MSDTLSVCIWVAEGILVVATLLTIIRMWRGPSLMDRLMSLDFLTMIIIGLILLEAHRDEVKMSLAPAVALALVSFVATIAFARLLEKHPERKKQ